MRAFGDEEFPDTGLRMLVEPDLTEGRNSEPPLEVFKVADEIIDLAHERDECQGN